MSADKLDEKEEKVFSEHPVLARLESRERGIKVLIQLLSSVEEKRINEFIPKAISVIEPRKPSIFLP
jgi:hypothetical protein